MDQTCAQNRHLLISVFLLLLGTLCGCGASGDPPSAEPPSLGEGSEVVSAEGFPRSIHTLDGEVVIPRKPRRIVSQTLGTDEVLLEICPLDRLVGIHTVSLDPAFSNCLDLSQPLRERAVNGAEGVISLEPDLVFVAGYSRAEVVAQLRAGCGAPIVRFTDFDSLEDIRRNINQIGWLIGEETAAAELVSRMDSRISAVVSGIPREGTAPRVVSFGPAAYTAGFGTLFNDLLETVGAVNLAAENGVNQFGQIGVEQVAFWDPDWIICGVDPGAEEATWKWFRDNPLLQATRAGREDRLLLVPNRLYTAVTHHIADLVELLAAELYSPSPSKPSD